MSWVARLPRVALLAAALSACLRAGGGAEASSSPALGVAAGEEPAPPAPAPAAASSAAPPDAPAPAEATSAVAPAPAAPAGPELPLGGRTIFPRHRLVGLCGTPGAPALGTLMGNLPKRAKALAKLAEPYAEERTILPVFELIAVVVQGAPGKDGKSRRRVSEAVVDEYLREARDAKALLLLNVQPGHSDFLTELKHFEKYLREPDVGVALDPEWAMKPKQKPGVFYGQATGAVVDQVATYLAGIVEEGNLPEKALVVHQMNGYVLKDEQAIQAHPGIAIIKSVDGLGPKGAKIKTYNYLVKSMPASMHAGFKLFFDEDSRSGARLMTPREVLALVPKPEYVMYE